MSALARFSLLGLALTTPAYAEVACQPERAIYAHEESGFRLSFRPPESWEQTGMTIAVFDVALRDGRTLWGVIRSGMGTSRDVGQIFSGCPRPGPEDVWDEDALLECQVWQGVVYAVEGDRVSAFPADGAKAPRSLLFSDLGRQLRYEIFDSPGEEPWDQLFLAACPPAPPPG